MKCRLATRRRARLIKVGLAAAWLGLVAWPALAGQGASADSRPAGAYAGGAALFTGQPGTSLGAMSGDTSLEGKAVGFSGLFGAGGRLSVEGQVTRGPALEGLVGFHVSGGTATYTSTFRDTLVSAFVRWRGGSPSSRVLVEPVGGVTLAFGDGTTAQAFVPDTPGSDPQGPWEQEVKRRSLGFGGGLDVLFPVGRRAAVGGLVRLHRLVWNDTRNLDVINTGLGNWVYQAGAVVRVDLAPAVAARSGARERAAPGPGNRRGYIAGFVGLFSQPIGEVDSHYLTEGVGGRGLGFGGTAGAFIHPRWSVAAEVSRGPEFEAQSFFAGRIRYDTRYRDTLISALLRWHGSASSRVQLEPVFGATVAAGHAPRTSTWIALFGSSAGEPTDATITRVSFGAVGGADVVVPAGRVAGVASFRLHLLDRNDVRNDQPPELGVGSFVYVMAGGLRVTF